MCHLSMAVRQDITPAASSSSAFSLHSSYGLLGSAQHADVFTSKAKFSRPLTGTDKRNCYAIYSCHTAHM